MWLRLGLGLGFMGSVHTHHRFQFLGVDGALPVRVKAPEPGLALLVEPLAKVLEGGAAEHRGELGVA